MTSMVRRFAPIIGLCVIVIVDLVLKRVDAPLVPTGLLDETAHLLTGVLCLGALMPGLRPEWLVGVAIGSNFIDLDHIPLLLDWDYFTRGTVRPYSHSLTTIAILIILIPALRLFSRTACWSVGLGVLLHLIRDGATGGVPLFWPLSKTTEQLPYPVYVSIVAIATVVFTVRVWHRTSSPLLPLRDSLGAA